MRKALAFAYSIWDPTGNITALVESPVEIAEQPAAAARIMEAHEEVEQVGFVRFFSDAAHPQAELRMAGGEFCGNASMCTAALCRLQGKTAQETIDLRVSGASGLVQVTLHEEGDAAFRAKCVAALREAAREEGRTVLFVSHNMESVRALCERCIVLEKGRLVFDGPVDDAIAIYLQGPGERAE